MAKKELDKLSQDMIQCEKDGFGVHYGKWKATQKQEEFNKELSDEWRVCAWCGKRFKPKTKKKKLYCDAVCQEEAQKERDRLRHAQKRKEKMEAESGKSENVRDE